MNRRLPHLCSLSSVAVALALCALLTTGCETTDTPKPAENDPLPGGTTSADLESMREFARLYWDKGEFDKAASQYERILGVRPDDAEATLGLGMSYAQIGHLSPTYFEKGEDALRRYHDEMANAGDVRGLMGLGILKFRHALHTSKLIDVALGRRRNIEDQLGGLSERQLTSDSAAERRRLSAEVDDWRNRLGTAEEVITKLERNREDQLAAAVRYLTQTMEQNRLEVLPYKLRAEAQSLRGPRYYGEAVKDLDTYLELTVESARDRFQSLLDGGVDSAGNDVPQGEVLQRLKRLDVLEAKVLLTRASLLRRMGRPGEAADDLQRVLYLFPERSAAFAELARCHEELGSYQDAIDYWRQYTESLPIGAIDAKANAQMRIEDLRNKLRTSER